MSNLSREHIDELWRRMTQIFGGQWTSQFGESDHADTWLRALSDFSPEDLSVGLNACVNMKPDEDGNLFPPNLPKFRAMCRPKDTRPTYYDSYKVLPVPTLTKEEALAHIAKLREALK